MRGLDPSWDGAKNSADRDLLKLHERLRRDLVLPEKLPRKLRGWFLSWLHSFRRSSKGLGGSSVDEEKLLSLRNEIENYVRHNAVDLLDELADMATRREDIAAGREGHGRRKDIIDKDKTFVVVAGQASQFAPVAYAIREHLAREYDLPFENVHFLRSTDAKEACCRGAVHFLRSLVNLANPGELHGVYGFLNAAANEQANAFKAADMAAIRAGGACTVTFKYGAQYWLIFSPRIEVKTGLSPRLFDGKTAIISGFEGYQFNLRYEPDLMALFVNEQEVQLATYGGVNESIYPKTWPEVLKPITPPRPN
jgi:hypothetical protein